MSSANVQGMIEQGKRALRDNNKAEAQTFLMRAVELDQYNEEAWLWLSSAVDTEEEQRTCLDNVLIISPNNTQAQQMLAELNRSQNQIMESNPFEAQLGGSGAAKDSAKSAPPSNNPPMVRTAAPGSPNPFSDIDDASATDSPFDEQPTTSPFGDFGNANPFESGVNTNPFGDAFSSGFLEEEDNPFSSNPFAAPPVQQAAETPPPTAAPPEPKPVPAVEAEISTPIIEDDLSEDRFSVEQPKSRPEDDLLSDILSTDGASTSPTEAPLPTASVLLSPADPVTGDDFFDDENDDFDFDYDDGVDYLDLIPKGIKPTRLPGMDEVIASGLRNSLRLVVLLNIIAVIVLIIQFVF